MSNSTVSTGLDVNVKTHSGIVKAIVDAKKAIMAGKRKENRLYIEIAEFIIADNVGMPQLVASYIEGGYKETTARTTASRIFLLTRKENAEVFEKVKNNEMTMRAALSKMQSANPREKENIEKVLSDRFYKTTLHIVFKDGLDNPRCSDVQFTTWAQKAYRQAKADLEKIAADKAEKEGQKRAKTLEKVNVRITETRKSGKVETHRHESKAA